MSWDDFKDVSKEEKIKEPVYGKVKFNGFAVIRIGRKYKEISGIGGFAKHMERIENTPNANKEFRDKNQVIIGSKNILQDSKEYLKDTFIRKNSVVGREILVTASRNFFVGLPQSQLDKWIDINVKFLQGEYGECLRYVCLHMDESVPHLHALVIPRVYNERYQKYTLQNYKFFDGKTKFYKLQDDYATSMKSFDLQRGIKFSKAKHIEIRHFYSLINEKVNEEDMESILANSKNAKLLQMKLLSTEKTLQAYRNYYEKTDIEKVKLAEENKDLIKEFKELSNDKELYKEVIESMAYSHHMSQNAVKQVFTYVKENNGKELEK